jgi:transposase
VKGRKRHLAVDSLGLPLALHVTGAHVQDSQPQAAGTLLVKLRQSNRCSRLTRVFADGNYRGTADLWAGQMGFALIRVTRIGRAFEKLPKRWVIERTFAWLMNCRRLLFDLEYKPINSEAMLWLATLRLFLRRAWPGTS